MALPLPKDTATSPYQGSWRKYAFTDGQALSFAEQFMQQHIYPIVPQTDISQTQEDLRNETALVLTHFSTEAHAIESYQFAKRIAILSALALITIPSIVFWKYSSISWLLTPPIIATIPFLLIFPVVGLLGYYFDKNLQSVSTMLKLKKDLKIMTAQNEKNQRIYNVIQRIFLEKYSQQRVINLSESAMENCALEALRETYAQYYKEPYDVFDTHVYRQLQDKYEEICTSIEQSKNEAIRLGLIAHVRALPGEYRV